jgi:hypothetical protein
MGKIFIFMKKRIIYNIVPDKRKLKKREKK